MLLIAYVLTVVIMFMVGLALETVPTWLTAVLMGLILGGPLWLLKWEDE